MMLMSNTVPMGTVVAYMLAIDSVPSGWLLCDGSAIPPQYQDLITALGSETTPNLGGRTLIGQGAPTSSQSDGQSPNFPENWSQSLGYTGGEFQHVLSADEMPEHTHGYDGVYGYDIYDQDGDDVHLMCTNNTGSTTTSAGGGAAHNTMQPYYVVNYIIFTGQAD